MLDPPAVLPQSQQCQLWFAKVGPVTKDLWVRPMCLNIKSHNKVSKLTQGQFLSNMPMEFANIS